MPESILAAEEIGLTYGSGPGRIRAIDRVSVAFDPGRATLICGPSGSGKTTLLAVLGCLLSPQVGEVRLMGRLTSRLSETERSELRRRYVGFVFQSFRLFRALSAIENVLLALDIAGSKGRQARDRSLCALDFVGLGPKRELMPDQLSGGEKQRVAIARAIANDAPILLADEPTASLDSEAALRIAERLSEIAKRQKKLVVIVSHDVRLRRFCDRVIRLEDGRIAEDLEASGESSG